MANRLTSRYQRLSTAKAPEDRPELPPGWRDAQEPQGIHETRIAVVGSVKLSPGFLRGPRPGISRVRLGYFRLFCAAVECEKSASHYANWAA